MKGMMPSITSMIVMYMNLDGGHFVVFKISPLTHILFLSFVEDVNFRNG